MKVEQLVECELTAETEELGENPLHCHFVHHKSYKNWPGIGPGDQPPDLYQGPVRV
jgi:hypothetical protein